MHTEIGAATAQIVERQGPRTRNVGAQVRTTFTTTETNQLNL